MRIKFEEGLMRVFLAIAACVFSVLSGGAAFAMDAILNNAADGGALVHAVRPGGAFDIVGDCLNLARSAHELRVMLQLADKPDAADMGYREVLATEQQLDDGALHVRVPEMPEMTNHVFRVKVFALEPFCRQPVTICVESLALSCAWVIAGDATRLIIAIATIPIASFISMSFLPSPVLREARCALAQAAGLLGFRHSLNLFSGRSYRDVSVCPGKCCGKR